jgi:hypothetical protein
MCVLTCSDADVIAFFLQENATIAARIQSCKDVAPISYREGTSEKGNYACCLRFPHYHIYTHRPISQAELEIQDSILEQAAYELSHPHASTPRVPISELYTYEPQFLHLLVKVSMSFYLSNLTSLMLEFVIRNHQLK